MKLNFYTKQLTKYFCGSFFIALCLLPLKANGVEVGYNTSKTYTAVTFNGFDKYKFQTNNRLSSYHYSHAYHTRAQKQLNESRLSPQQLKRKNELTEKALADFQDPEKVAKYRKNDYENLSTAIGFGFGVSKINFNNETQLSQNNLNQRGKTIRDANGINLQINLTIRGVLTLYYAPALYMANVIVQNGQNGQTRTEKQFTTGHALGFVTRIMPFSKSEGLVVGLGSLFVNNTSRPYFTIGLLIE